MKLVASPNNQKDFTRNQPDTSPTRSSGRRVILAGQPEPPPSEVSEWTGLTGLVGLAIAIFLIFTYQKELPAAYKSLEILGATAFSMIIFELIRLKGYRSIIKNVKSYFIKKSNPQSVHNDIVRMLGVLVTIVPFTIVYFILQEFSKERYGITSIAFLIGLPIMLVLFAAYFFITGRKGPSPQDIYWYLGMYVLRKKPSQGVPGVAEHWRQWALKAFFVPFMFAIVYANTYFVDKAIETFTFDLFHIFILVHLFAFMADTVFGTIGYITSFRLLDSHIRSTQDSIFGWMVCLICYPPLLLVLYSFGNFQTAPTWDKLLADTGPLIWLWAVIILAFECVYAWATVIFGLRFSNLTHRGIITNGPYRYFKHPAYFAKNISWWLFYLPFIPVISIGAAAANSAQLLLVNYIYYLRAKTEERHLLKDERYRAYVQWIDSYGVLSKLRRAIASTKVGSFAFRSSEHISRRLFQVYERYAPFKHFIRRP